MPPAVSKSLSKLRTRFSDPLFVNTPLGLPLTPLMVSMEQSLAEWIRMGNQLFDESHYESPHGLRSDLAAETPLVVIMFDTFSQQIHQRYPQAIIRIHNWDYDSLDATIRGEVGIGFTGRENHPHLRGPLNLLSSSIDHEVLFSDLPCAWLRGDHPVLQEEWNLDTFLRYSHISVSWEQNGIWVLDKVLQEVGCAHDIALCLSGFEQSLFMAVQPDRALIAAAPVYCQRYNQLRQFPLVARSMSFDATQLEKMYVSFILLWHKHNGHNPKVVRLEDTIKVPCHDIS